MTCEWCGEPYPYKRGQRFCSKQCAGLHQYRDHPRTIHKWGKRPPLDREHRRLRAIMVPAAVGLPCPLCGITMRADNVDLDHVLPRSQGGASTRDNCRVVCRPCNRRRGAQLGGRVGQHGRQHHDAPEQPPRHRSPHW